jgi:hypothetical protein
MEFEGLSPCLQKPVSILRQMNSVLTTPRPFSKIHFNSILPPTS